ncbi:MAG: ATP-binding protein [Muribaculaceae bacterium]|nr:ATP-binding protein [Muribaculaceae bacterium]
MSEYVTYAVGQQDFRNIREAGSVYIDKTQFIEKIIRQNNQFMFLARPRRFGKSLFLSTLRYFFEGKRELFKGLCVDSMDWDWHPYPVLYLDLNPNRYDIEGKLEAVLNGLFRDWEKKYSIDFVDPDYSQRLRTIIKTAHEKTGRQVVILVDEYDKPLVGNMNNEEQFEHYQAQLASIYSNFKTMAEDIRLVFLTGVSRFSKLSVFSDLNNLNDISFDNEYADICGITADELFENFQTGINGIAREAGRDYEWACEQLRQNYDGYRFAIKGSDIYNPWSVLNAMQKSVILFYWNQTGRPTVVAEALRNMDVDLESLDNTTCTHDELMGLDLKNPNPLALMYQTGYLTIKDYDPYDNVYTLGIPNKEARDGLFNELVPFYVSVKKGSPENVVREILKSIREGNPKLLVKNLNAFLAGIPYDMHMEDENNLQNAIFVLLTLIGANAQVEVHTSDGRIDMLIEHRRFIYIIELKFDGSAEDAIDQIRKKEYARKFDTDPRSVFSIGLNFSTRTRRLDPPVIE